ncbi:alpha/beta fold hydrolase [Kineosporia babensis]|uniref:Alpha/beta hydrolase n=1 Tax=Kineosporia babensis TaxID=499548 RepID=A0A9X1N9T0_9ACTN|nr:alpha/beta hydrolase [Kineosporia babensis]MCD5309784.1 alpha/beta hydrolase [Kineosporia babensis]
MTTIFTTSGGVGISYSDTGTPEGPVLVLLHALGDSQANWQPVLPAFEAGHRVVNVTLRGHAPSAYPGDYSYQTMFADVVELLDALKLQKATVLGHSLGGMVAYQLAVERPDLVARLITEDVAPGDPTPPRELPERPEGELPFDWEMLKAIRPQVDAGALELREQLSTVAAPTLLIGGGASSTVPQAWLAEAAARIPEAELVTVGGGHFVHQELPQEFTAAVLAWLERHPVLLT